MRLVPIKKNTAFEDSVLLIGSLVIDLSELT